MMKESSNVQEQQNNSLDKVLSSSHDKMVIRVSSLVVPLIVGYFQYVDSYQFPKWKVFLSGVIMGAPFSLGIFLSTLTFGKKSKIFASVLILFSALIRSLLLLPLQVSYFVFMIELYAIWKLFARRVV